ncbi:MAG TPA: twin-arginine translocase subunit TatC [Steroidobacteraceae bacterium]|nr:twin-arginine translocase subunit TatC [Steroidobacteraceae bacterium]
MSEDAKNKENLKEGTLISHLLELRDRLVRAFLAVFVVFVPAAIYRNELFEALARPLLAQLPKGSSLIATTVMSPFGTPFKLSFFFALFVAMPFVLYQIWAFVAPGLYRKEKRFAVPLLVSAIVLFYVGAAFAYYFVFPMAFKFFSHSTPLGVQMMPDINSYLDFALTLFLAFGVAFEVPVVVVLLTLTGLVPVEKLSQARGYVIIGIFVVAAIMTPPDPLSQCMMAIPMWLLYEGGVLMARVMKRSRSAAANSSNAGDAA